VGKSRRYTGSEVAVNYDDVVFTDSLRFSRTLMASVENDCGKSSVVKMSAVA